MGRGKDSVCEQKNSTKCTVFREIIILLVNNIKADGGKNPTIFDCRGSNPHNKKTPEGVLEMGQGWIRTTVHSREQIYSLSPLATRPPTHIQFSFIEILRFAQNN